MKCHRTLPLVLGILLHLVPSLTFPQDREEAKEESGQSATDRVSKIEKKLREITIPSIQFADTPLQDCLEFLQQRSREIDPEKVGVDILFDVDTPPGDTPVEDTRITLRLSNVPLAEALRYTTSLAQLKYRVEPHAVVILPLSAPDAVFTNVYIVPPTFLKSDTRDDAGHAGPPDPFLPDGGRSGGPKPLPERKSARATLENAGITFGEGTSAVYNVAKSQLIVRNTQDQMELVEAYIATLSETPKKEIFIILEVIEVQATDFSDWLQENTLHKNATVLRKAVQEWVKGGKGNIREILTVQTRSGQRAKVEAIEETIYPTDFTIPSETPDPTASGEKASPEDTAPAKAFETRNIGTTLEVDPVYSPEGFVDLNLAPELVIADEPFTYEMASADGTYPVELPRFITCKITTQITVAKGEYGYLGNARLGRKGASDGDNTLLLFFIRADFD